MNFFKPALLVFFTLAMQPALAVESGTVLKADAIKKEPYSDAKTVAMLKAGDKVSILKKDGGWLNVKSAKGNGWVRMLSIRRGEPKKDKGVADTLMELKSGRAGTGKIVATTGIRGLNEEELRAAKFDADELRLAASYMSTRAEAQSFAGQGKLRPRSLDYLPLPQ